MTLNHDTKQVAIDDLVFGDVALREAQVNHETFGELVRSIAKYGVQQPILARPLTDENGKVVPNKLEVCDGCQRTNAATQAGLKKIPCVIMEMTDDEASARQIIANTHRIPTKPKQLLDAVRKIMIRHPNWNQERLAEELTMSQPQLSKILSLKNLIPEAMDAVQEGSMRLTVAYSLAKAPTQVQEHLMSPESGEGSAAALNSEVTVAEFQDILDYHSKEFRATRKINTDEGDRPRIYRPFSKNDLIAKLIAEETKLQATKPNSEDFELQTGRVESLQEILRVDPTSVAQQEQEAEAKKLAKQTAKLEKQKQELVELQKQLEEQKAKVN